LYKVLYNAANQHKSAPTAWYSIAFQTTPTPYRLGIRLSSFFYTSWFFAGRKLPLKHLKLLLLQNQYLLSKAGL
jgi:hypothetical protein